MKIGKKHYLCASFQEIYKYINSYTRLNLYKNQGITTKEHSSMANNFNTSGYILIYQKMYEAKFGEKKDFNTDNFMSSIAKYFDFDIYLEVMNKIHQDLPEDKEGDKYQDLKSLKSDLFDIANKVYFQNFYEEVSLEEKVRADGFSFDVSIFKPLKRSVLFN